MAIYDDPYALDQAISDLRLVAAFSDAESKLFLYGRIDALRRLACDNADARLRAWMDEQDDEVEEKDYAYGRGKELYLEFREGV